MCSVTAYIVWFYTYVVNYSGYVSWFDVRDDLEFCFLQFNGEGMFSGDTAGIV